MQRKAITFILAVLMLFSVCGCTPHEKKSDRISIVATMFPEYDIAREIVGSYCDVTMLLKPGQEAHQFEPTPDNIRKIQNCDVFFYGGGESDTWLDEVLASVDSSKMQIVSMTEIVELLEEEESEGMDVRGEGEGEEEAEYDEHVWTSPVNVMEIATELTDVLCGLDAENAEVYRNNLNSYLLRLTELDASFREVVGLAENKTLVFGDRFPLLYFVKEYGLEFYAAFPGCSANTEPSAKTLAFLIDTVKEQNIPVVFKIELSNDNIARTISEETGAKVLTFYTCHNVSKQDFENGETYVSLMTKNIESLKEALKICP